jgi:hypothetical protein
MRRVHPQPLLFPPLTWTLAANTFTFRNPSWTRRNFVSWRSTRSRRARCLYFNKPSEIMLKFLFPCETTRSCWQGSRLLTDTATWCASLNLCS